MSNIASMVGSYSAYSNQGVNQTRSSKKSAATEDTASVDNTSSTSSSKKTNYGQTIGKPQLSEKAAKYYKELKGKYSNMNFILVSEDQKENAKANAASYANANNMVVLVDEDKIERMAEDENYRKQIEGVIANAANGLSQLASGISSSGASVKGYGIQVNDNGTASYFAVLEKSSTVQKERIEKKTEEKKEAKKAAAKKAEKEEREDRLKKAAEEGTKIGDSKDDSENDTITITANSIEELLQKIQDYSYVSMSDNVQTDEEKQIGQKFDFSV